MRAECGVVYAAAEGIHVHLNVY